MRESKTVLQVGKQALIKFVTKIAEIHVAETRQAPTAIMYSKWPNTEQVMVAAPEAPPMRPKRPERGHQLNVIGAGLSFGGRSSALARPFFVVTPSAKCARSAALNERSFPHNSRRARQITSQRKMARFPGDSCARQKISICVKG